jgi:peptide subunit release factor 1 (eRF1)
MNESDLHLLFSRAERMHPSVLSVYLNVDQSRQANRNRGFEKQLKDIMASIRNSTHDPSDLEKFTHAAHHVTDFVSAYQPGARGLVLFFDESDGFFWHMETDVQLHNQARWDRELLLQPLANALDQFERYGVVLVDRNNVRLFTVFLGEVEELVRKGFGPNKVRHIKTVGTDHIASASAVQRKADEQIRLNLRHVTKEVDSLVQTKQINRLVLAGTPEITTELRDQLPKRLSVRVIGAVDVAMDVPPADVLAATRNIAAEYESSTELVTVREVVTAAAKKQKAVVGLEHTLRAVNSDRIWQLIYSEDFSSPGFECVKCAALLSAEKASCPYCGAALRSVNDVVERAVEHALRKGAKIEIVTGEASASLDSAGGIGAFLKARTGTIQV